MPLSWERHIPDIQTRIAEIQVVRRMGGSKGEGGGGGQGSKGEWGAWGSKGGGGGAG